MSSSARNRSLSVSPFLRVQRQFPDDNSQALSVEVDRSWVDIANAVNYRTIGIFTVNVQGASGEFWFLEGGNRRLQGLRQVYVFTAAVSIPHGINVNSVNQFTKCSGSFTDGTNWYGAIFGSNTTIAGQVSFYVTPTNIVIQAGAGAPTIVSGSIVLEWISQV